MAINYPQRYDDDFINIIKKVIDHVNEYGKTIQDLVADGQLTEEQYGNLISTVNGMLKSGEVDRADLTPELRSEVDKVRNKIDKGEVSVHDININMGKLTPRHLSEEVLSMIAGDAPVSAEIDDQSVTTSKVADKAITAQKTDFINLSSNLFDKREMIDGYTIDASTGETVENPTYSASSSFIEVSNNATYTAKRSGSYFGRIFLYDENFNWVSYVALTTGNERVVFQTPENVHYRKVAIETNALDSLQINVGDVDIAYEEYTKTLDTEEIEVPIKNISEKIPDKSLPWSKLDIDKLDIEKMDFVVYPSNLIDESKITERVIIDPTTGELTNNDDYWVSDYIPAYPNTDYTGFYRRAFYYDGNRNIISNDFHDFELRHEPGTFTTPEGTKEIRIQVYLPSNIPAHLNLGSTLLPYEEYHEPYIDPKNIPFLEEGEGRFKYVDFSPAVLDEYYEPDETLSYDLLSTQPSETSVSDYYAMIDQLMTEHPDYIIEKTDHGLDESGVYNIFEYVLNGEGVGVPSAMKKKKPKILIVSGVHGEEKSSVFSLYYLIRDICKNWRNNKALEYLRWNVELKIIPVANPDGFMNNDQRNSRGVNINRNFELNFDDYRHIVDGEQLYGGPEPFSEVESRYIRDFINENLDAIYYCDYHNHGTSGSDYNNLMWHANPAEPYNFDLLDTASKYHIEQSTRKWIERYNMPDDQGYFGFISHSDPPRTASYASQKGMIAHTFEVYRKLPVEEQNFNPVAMKGCTEYFGNWLTTLIRHFRNS